MNCPHIPAKLLIPFIFGAMLLAPQAVSAQVLSQQQLKLDPSIIIKDSAFSVPTKVLVVPIFLPQGVDAVGGRDWFRGLYYYSIANSHRSGFTDVPFHYVVTSTGEMFKANSGGEERKINIQGVGDDVIVIGYLADANDNAFDPRSESALSTLILDVCNRNAIRSDKVSVASVSYVRDDEAKSISITKKEVFGLWNSSLAKVLEPVARQYSPISKVYTAQIVKVETAEAAVNPDDSVTGKIVIKNTGEFGFYPETLSEIVPTKVSGASRFYTANGWLGTSQFSLEAEDKVLLPGDEKEFTFKLRAPLYFGEQVEKFSLRTVGGVQIAATEFDLKLNVNKPSGAKIVEVAGTQTGWLRVRSAPSGAAAELTKISTGERYYQTGDEGNGWIKIKLTDGREGWVSRQYLIYP